MRPYPMVAPAHAEKRRDLAKKIDLSRKPGQKRGRATGSPLCDLRQTVAMSRLIEFAGLQSAASPSYRILMNGASMRVRMR